MKEVILRILEVIAVAIIICATVFALAKCEAAKKAAVWNNGYCECGGHWRYEQAVGHQYRTSYIYKCDECGNRIEVSKYYQEAD